MEKAAKKVKGVKAVAEDIVVGISVPSEKSDTEIAEAITNAIKWHTAVREEKIKIKVKHGLVTHLILKHYDKNQRKEELLSTIIYFLSF